MEGYEGGKAQAFHFLRVEGLGSWAEKEKAGRPTVLSVSGGTRSVQVKL